MLLGAVGDALLLGVDVGVEAAAGGAGYALCRVAELQPMLEFLHCHSVDRSAAAGAAAVAEPPVVGLDGVSLRLEAEEAFVLVKLFGAGVDLINDVNLSAIGVRSDIAIDMVSVCALRPFDVAIVGGHDDRPPRTCGADAAARRALEVFNGNVEALKPHVMLLVVSGLFLRLCRTPARLRHLPRRVQRSGDGLVARVASVDHLADVVADGLLGLALGQWHGESLMRCR